MPAASLTLPALRGQFGDWVYYSCLMPLGELAERVDYASEVHPSAAMSEFIQRSLEGPRAGHIANYLTNTPDRFFNSLVLAVYGGAPVWLELGNYRAADPKMLKLLTPQAKDSIGFLHLDGREKIFALDGQHRLAGIKRALKVLSGEEDEQVSVILVSHRKSAKGMQRTRRLFTTLNKTAVAVRKRDIIALDEDDVMAITVRRMVETDDRFREPKIALVASQNIPNSNATALTTIASLYDLLKLLFMFENSSRQDRGLRFNRPPDARLEKYYKSAITYFEALGATFAPVAQLLRSADPGTVTGKFRNAQGGHLLFRPIGLEIFTRTVIELAKRRDCSLAQAVGALRAMPMDLRKPPFRDVIWDVNRGVIKSQGKLVAREVMFYMAGVPTRDPPSDLVRKYRVMQGSPASNTSMRLPATLRL